MTSLRPVTPGAAGATLLPQATLPATRVAALVHLSCPSLPTSALGSEAFAVLRGLRLASGVLLAIFLVWKFPAFKAQAELGSAYAARVGCSCRYVQGRNLESCQTDFEPGMEMVSLSDDPATKTVTGSVPLLASRSARFAGASGCLINPSD